MKNLLIGSRAMEVWFNMKVRPNADYDIISSQPIGDSVGEAKVEWHDPSILLNSELQNYASNYVIQVNGVNVYVVNPMGLALVKRSHLWRDLSFDKHIAHYSKYLCDFVDNANDEELDYLARRTKATMQMFPQGNPNLMQSKEDFFNDAVEKKYDHDYLHELFAYYDKPLYTRLLRDPNLAWCEQSKWNDLSFEDKVKCVAEEVQVIAAERFLIRKNWEFPTKLAYYNATKKVCTTLCSGWFRDFAIDEFNSVMSMYDHDRFMNVKNILERN